MGFPRFIKIDSEKFDLNKLKGVLYKEELAKEASNNSYINTIFENIDGIEINGVKGKKDGKLDNIELTHLAKMLNFSSGKNNKLSKKELKNLWGFHGLRNYELKDIAHFLQIVTDKLQTEDRPILKQIEGNIKEDAKNKIFQENFITEELFNKYYIYNEKQQSYLLKNMTPDEKKEYDNDFCNAILDKIRTAESLRDLKLNNNMKISSDYGYITVYTKEHKVVFKQHEDIKTAGVAEFYKLKDENEKTTENLFDIFAINKRNEKSRDFATNRLIDLYIQNKNGSKELLGSMNNIENPNWQYLYETLKTKIEDLVDTDPYLYMDITTNLNETIAEDPRLEDYNKFMNILGREEFKPINRNTDYIKKDNLKILRDPNTIVDIEDHNHTFSTEGFKFDDTKLDGKINHWSDLKQSCYGNCWQIAALQSLLLNNNGKNFINNEVIKRNNVNNVSINTAIRTQTFDNETVKSLPGILSEKSDKDAIALARCIRSFNEEYEHNYTGGCLQDFIINIFGKESLEHYKQIQEINEVNAFIKNNKTAINSHKYLTQLGFYSENLDDVKIKITPLKNTKEKQNFDNIQLMNGHAYTIESINNGYINVIDPNHHCIISFSIEDLSKRNNFLFEYAEIDKLIESVQK